MREFDVSDIGFKLLDMIVKENSRNEQNLLGYHVKNCGNADILFVATYKILIYKNTRII